MTKLKAFFHSQSRLTHTNSQGATAYWQQWRNSWSDSILDATLAYLFTRKHKTDVEMR